MKLNCMRWLVERHSRFLILEYRSRRTRLSRHRFRRPCGMEKVNKIHKFDDFNSLFRHNFLAVDKTRRCADAFHVPAAASMMRPVAERRKRGEAAVHGTQPPESVWREHVVHQREAQERRHDILRM